MTLLTAIFVALIAFLQWRTATKKLRLDLYNRRFQVYSATLDFNFEIQSFNEESDENNMKFEKSRRDFIKCFRESQFLFNENSGIYHVLDEMHKASFKVTGFFSIYKTLEASSEESTVREFIKSKNEMVAAKLLFFNSIYSLENKLNPYLNFYSLILWNDILTRIKNINYKRIRSYFSSTRFTSL